MNDINLEQVLTKFAFKLAPDSKLEKVDRKVEPFSLLNECYKNVETKVDNDGGKCVYGWLIEPHYFNSQLYLVEAIAHSIWQSDDAQRLCISPDQNEYSYFVEDLNNVVGPYNRIPNYRYFLKGYDIPRLDVLLEVIDYLYIKLTDYVEKELGYRLLNSPISFSYNKDADIAGYELNGVFHEHNDVNFKKLIKLYIRSMDLKHKPYHGSKTDKEQLKFVLDVLSYRPKYSFDSI